MRILTTDTVMKTNPKFDFYSTLFRVMRSESFLLAEAKCLLLMVNDYPEITLPDVTLDNLEEWHEQYSTNDIHNKGMTIMKTMIEHFFTDLATQMRNEPVRDLFMEWKTWSGILDDLFIHVRKSTDLGCGISTLTIMTDDISAFRRFCEDPDQFGHSSEVHFSESEMSMDPV